MIRAVASGVSDPQQQFRFLITPIADGVEEMEIEFSFPDYQSGQYEVVLVESLQQGRSYIFSGVAVNIFGRSELAYSTTIVLEGLNTYKTYRMHTQLN